MVKFRGPGADGRPEALRARRQLKMAKSAHAYVRGSTIKFYEWLEDRAGDLPDGPPVWICGDCHVGNLGPLADAQGKVAIQIRDLDQTVIGNPAHDLIRLGLSLASAVRSSDLPGVTTARMLEAVVQGYEQALRGDSHDELPPEELPKIVKEVLRRSLKRQWRHLANERLDGVAPVIPLGRRFWPLTPEEKKALAELFADDAVARTLTGLRGHEGRDVTELIDASYWIKGCSSLGRLRYAALVKVGASDTCLVDIKEATPPAAPRTASAKMPRNNAERVVTGARALSPHLGKRMLATGLLGKAVVLRELMPQDLKLEIRTLDHQQATAIAAYLANIVGQAHGRQMDKPTRKAWRDTFTARNTRALDTPSWLWSSVVDLLAIHESAYLEHCRRFALPQQKRDDAE
jgi:uncharacterized protein (DUF2252 family)